MGKIICRKKIQLLDYHYIVIIMNNLEIHTSDSLHYAFPFYIVGLLLMVGYAGAHPYIKNYCKGRL
ncbi:hypothetical protein FACS1894218_3950 [Bacilli bacterium]|nr:hypothetical protein FACS1894218_3950 [Bacilli bacterium]